MNKFLLTLNPEKAGQEVPDLGAYISKSALTRYILSHSDSPVILALVTFEQINEIVFTCDGSKASGLGAHSRNPILRLLMSGTVRSVSNKLFNPIFIAHNQSLNS